MLPEWYFCCCIESSPDQTVAFLSTLEVLDNPESNGSLLYLAYRELRRTEIWMQIYALPQVLESLHREDLPDGIRSVVEPYFRELIELVHEDANPAEARWPFNELINLILEGKAASDDIKATLQACAQTTLRLSDRNATPTPYLDLKEFIPETLLLAVMADRITHDRTFSSKLARDLQEAEELSPLSKLLQNALDYGYGRLAWRLAVRITHYGFAAYAQDNTKILSLLSSSLFSVVEFEPDLLHTYAEILFLYSTGQMDAEQRETITKAIIEESFTFHHLQTLLRHTFPRTGDPNAPLRRIGLEVITKPLKDSLPLIYWQATLWELAAQLDAQTTAATLAPYWQLPGDRGAEVNLSSPYSGKEVNDWKFQLITLMKLRSLDTASYLRVDPAEDLFIPPQYRWLFFSPWLIHQRARRRGSARQERGSYLEAEKPESFIRLLAGAVISVRLLQQLPEDADCRRQFASLIAHASDVCTTVYGAWFRRYTRDDHTSDMTKLSQPLTGLALFGHHHFHLAGCGRLDSISPECFVDLLRQRHNQDGVVQTRDEQDFLQRVLPEILMFWITDAFPGIVDRTGPGRWLSLIPEVYQYQPLNAPISKKVSAALVPRFLRPDYPLELDNQVDWRQAKDQKGRMEWRVRHRQLLLTERELFADEWLKPEWQEPEWGIQDYSQSTRLVRALERLAALLHQGDISQEIAREWRTAWKDCLNRIGKTDELDRFIRLRLLELLKHRALQDAPDDQELIILILFEYGSIYDLKKMFEIIYPENTAGSSVEVDEGRQRVQRFLLRMMYKEFEKQAIGLTETTGQLGAQSPRVTRISLQRADLIRDTLTKLAYLNRRPRGQQGLSALAADLVQLRQQTYEQSIRPTLRMLKTNTVEIETPRGKEKHLELPEGTRLENWSIRAAVYDPNILTTTLFFDDFDLDGIRNLFEDSWREVQALRNVPGEEPIYVLAVVVDVQHLNHGEVEYVFNCGLHFYLFGNRRNLRVQGEVRFRPGDYVTLPIYTMKENKNRWLISNKLEVKPIQRRLRPDAIEQIDIRESWREWDQRRRMTLRRGSSADWIDLPQWEGSPTLWDADISRGFREFSHDPHPVFARRDEKGQWTPIDLDLLDLLLKGCLYDDGHIAVLTLIQTLNGPFGETAWRVAVRPGENFLLYDHHFALEDVEKIKDVTRGLDDKEEGSQGLLLTVTPGLENGGVCLCLVERQVTDTNLAVFYPHLSTPFDYRNIAWRGLFKRSAIAEKEGAKWYVAVETDQVPGYPKRISIRWDKHSPNARNTTPEFTPTKWEEDDQRLACVCGDCLYISTVNPESNWQDFFERWMHVKPGDQVYLKDTRGKIEKDGFVSCLTNEYLLIRVEAESLTMQPLALHNRPDIEGNRIAEVFREQWWPLSPAAKIDPQNIPGEALIDGKCQGLLVQVPSGGTLCWVVWQTTTGIKRTSLQIENLTALRPRLGYRIRGVQKTTGWEFYLESLNILARALWSLQELAETHLDLGYLGTIYYGGKIRAIAESRPGELVLLPGVPEGVRHLATGPVATLKDRLAPDWRTTNTAEGRPWREGRSEYQRAVLTWNNSCLTGVCDADSPKRNLTVSDVQLRLVSNKRGENLFSLRREFRLRGAVEREEKKKLTAEEDSTILVQKLGAYLDNPGDLKATFQDGNLTLQTLKVPATPDGTSWTARVPLAQGEGVFVLDGLYSADARVRLFREHTDGDIFASFRRVPPHTLEEFRRHVGATFNDFFPLEDKLYYVGPEPGNPIIGDAYQEDHHRFEWGCGKTLLVSESKLRYGNGPFSIAQLILFHGDVITGVTFLPERFEDAVMQEEHTADGVPACIMAIDAINIQFSQGRSLFSQRRDYNIVHVLHLSTGSNGIQIDSVEGFDESRIQTEKRSFDRVRAHLTPASQRSLLLRQQKQNRDTDKLAILGRLDEERFRETLGQSISFEHVRLSFEESDEGSPLRDGELVFMQSARIINLTNDMALVIRGLDILKEEYIGKDMQQPVLLTRRNFSVREGLLRRITQQKGPNGLNGTILLVRLSKRDAGGAWTSLIRRIPPRMTRALAGAITSKEEPLFAAVVDHMPGGELHLELKPGVFIKLQREQIEESPDDLTSGSIVRVENRLNNKFCITRATFGEARYVPEGLRAVVALPKQNLLDRKLWDYDVESDAYWQNNKCFTIGGLPNIEASPGRYDAGAARWLAPKAEDFTRLMEQVHPKIVQLGYDALSEFRISCPASDLSVGRLEYTANGFAVTYVPLGKTVHAPECRTMDWHLLSFGDESVQQIIKRANQEKWGYHDSKTGTWLTNASIELQELEPHDIWKGPLFFEATATNLRLRYTEKNFPRFGFPVGESLRALAEECTYPVAGVSDKGGLWIELTPGRIVELPGQIVIWQTRGREKSLAHFNWEGCASGDRVQLEVAASDPLAIDRVVLKDWRPGPRKAFGPYRCLLPVRAYDAASGALQIGAGEFTLTLPMAHPAIATRTVVLNRDNTISGTDNSQPKPGDVILLGLDAEARPTVLGCPQLTPRPDQKNAENWEEDAFAADLLVKNNWEKFEFNYPKLLALIKAAGNALPFTVEYVSPQGNIFLSRRHQRSLSEIPPHKLTMAYVLGLLNEQTALLRCGGGIIKMKMDHIISGLPAKLFGAAMEVLKKSREIIWLRCEDQGEIKVGLNDERTRDISVEVLDVVSGEYEPGHDTGLICRATDSMMLYWLPATHASWTMLSVDQLRRIFQSPDRKTFEVRRISRKGHTDHISIIKERGVDREFSHLAVGSKLTVKAIEPGETAREFPVRYIVELFTSKAILECVMYEGDQLPLAKPIPVEIVRLVKGVPRAVTVVPVGQKQLSLDLPQWLVQALPGPGQGREELANYLRWRTEEAHILLDHTIDEIKTFSDEKVNELLCYAFKTRDSNQNTLRFQIQIAEEWMRRHRAIPEIAVAYAIMAILLLHTNGERNPNDFACFNGLSSQDIQNITRDWRIKALELTQELGRRALRSMHVEVLVKDWLYNEDNRKRSDDLWPRLQQIMENLHGSLKMGDIGAMQQFCYAVELRNMDSKSSLLSVSDALSAATGGLANPEKLYAKVMVTGDLLDIYRTLPLTRSLSQVALHKSHLRKLRHILGYIDSQKLDITLLDPLTRL